MARGQKYHLSFTAGGLLYSESLLAAQLFQDHGDWKAVRSTLMAENRLQARTPNTAKRIAQEVILRLKLLTNKQLELLLKGSPSEQKYLLWVAICKRYDFVRDFASEVVREKFLAMKYDVLPNEYDIFFQSKSENHPEMLLIAGSTRKKLGQVLFKMLREVGLISEENVIQPALLTHELADVLIEDNPRWLMVFPVSDSDIEGWMKR